MSEIPHPREGVEAKRQQIDKLVLEHGELANEDRRLISRIQEIITTENGEHSGVGPIHEEMDRLLAKLSQNSTRAGEIEHSMAALWQE